MVWPIITFPGYYGKTKRTNFQAWFYAKTANADKTANALMVFHQVFKSPYKTMWWYC